ncbi:hypothetical protein [Salinibacter ruber]|uniref:hypothetical protein n=1 Tax=Salinibacter ruber TaxID=146919 RepID=UPI002169543F|nr:hypothetical protein [Salinibacter ruber]MCS4201460.1 hypothetical protein [Salinibacter ruber]
MNFALAVFVVVGFTATLEQLNLPGHAQAVGERSSRSLSVLRDDSLGDREKEEALQSQSRELFRLLGILVGGSALALGLPLGIVWLLGQLGLGSFWGTIGVLERIDFLVGTAALGGFGYLAFRKLYPPT